MLDSMRKRKIMETREHVVETVFGIGTATGYWTVQSSSEVQEPAVLDPVKTCCRCNETSRKLTGCTRV